MHDLISPSWELFEIDFTIPMRTHRVGFELGFVDFHTMIFRHQQPRLRLLYPSEVAHASPLYPYLDGCTTGEDLELSILTFSIRANWSWQISLHFSEMFSVLLSRAALTFGKGQQIFVMPLASPCFVTVLFTTETVSRPGVAGRMMPAKRH